MAQVVQFAEVTPQPWANGGGVTRELLVTDAWRISIADLERPGPFSPFAGQARLFTVIEGTVVTLTVDGEQQHVESLRPFAFSGDAEVSAALPEGPARALNLIASHPTSLFATVLETSRSSVLPLAEDQAALVLQGKVASGEDSLAQYDLVLGPAQISGRGRIVVLSYGVT